MTLPYCKNFAERAVAVGVQTVMVTDVMQRFSDNFNTFVLDLESMNLEIAVVTSAVDVSGHETNIRVLQGTTVMTISLTQYSPWAMCKKRAFDIVVSLIALLVSAIVSVPVAIAIKLTDGGPIFLYADPCGPPWQDVQDDQVPFHGGERGQDEGGIGRGKWTEGPFHFQDEGRSASYQDGQVYPQVLH